MVADQTRTTLYGDCLKNVGATRMLHDGRHKLIWYPAGNKMHLFDLNDDPNELIDRADDPDCLVIRQTLEQRLAEHLYGTDIDLGWVKNGQLTGYEPPPFEARADLGFSGQRGTHFPEPPKEAQDQMASFPR